MERTPHLANYHQNFNDMPQSKKEDEGSPILDQSAKPALDPTNARKPGSSPEDTDPGESKSQEEHNLTQPKKEDMGLPILDQDDKTALDPTCVQKPGSSPGDIDPGENYNSTGERRKKIKDENTDDNNDWKARDEGGGKKNEILLKDFKEYITTYTSPTPPRPLGLMQELTKA